MCFLQHHLPLQDSLTYLLVVLHFLFEELEDEELEDEELEDEELEDEEQHFSDLHFFTELELELEDEEEELELEDEEEELELEDEEVELELDFLDDSNDFLAIPLHLAQLKLK